MKRLILFTFIFTVFSINAFAEESEFKFINHGIIFYEDISGADKSFIDHFKGKEVNINKSINSLLSEKYSENWTFYKQTSERSLVENIINMAMIIPRAGINEEEFYIDEKLGSLYRSTFNVGISLLFFKMTDQKDTSGVQLYYSRFITGAKVVKTPEMLSDKEKRQYFGDALNEGINLILENAYNEYNPAMVEGEIVEIKGKDIITSLNKKDGIMIDNFLTLYIDKEGIESYDILVKDIGFNNSTAVDEFEEIEPERLKTGLRVAAVVNAKRFANTWETFQLGKFKIKEPAAMFEPNKEDIAQIFHDYLVQTKKVNMMPSRLTISPATIESLKAKFNIVGSADISMPQADYKINFALLKVLSKVAKKGEIDEYRNYISYILAGVKDFPKEGKKGKLYLKEDVGETNLVHIVKGHTVTDKEYLYDVTQMGLKSLAGKIAESINNKMKLNVTD